MQQKLNKKSICASTILIAVLLIAGFFVFTPSARAQNLPDLDDFSSLDDALNLAQPAIIHITPGIDHFLVVDGKLDGDVYTVKDPRWYNTQVLDEADNRPNFIRDYNNSFDGIRLFVQGDGTPQKFVRLSLASPAELLVTDLFGRRLGKDPITSTVFDEIPDGGYFTDSIDDATGALAPVGKQIKNIYIPDPLDGDYLVTVIPEPSASLEDVYSLTASSGNEAISVAENVAIADIPQQPYVIRSSDGEIEQIISATLRIEPETLNLSHKGILAAFIELPVGFNSEDIDPTTVMLSGAPAIKIIIIKGTNTLAAQFKPQDLVDVPTGDAVPLTLTATFFNGASLEANDSIQIIKKGRFLITLPRSFAALMSLIAGIFANVGGA